MSRNYGQSPFIYRFFDQNWINLSVMKIERLFLILKKYLLKFAISENIILFQKLFYSGNQVIVCFIKKKKIPLMSGIFFSSFRSINYRNIVYLISM